MGSNGSGPLSGLRKAIALSLARQRGLIFRSAASSARPFPTRRIFSTPMKRAWKREPTAPSTAALGPPASEQAE